MEQEKLEEARRNLEEQKEKFEKTIRDSNAYVEDLGMQVRNTVKEKNELNDIIESLNAKINQKDTNIKKFEDELVDCKEHKNFLDVMAIQAGKKEYNPKVKATPVSKSNKPLGSAGP